ncbi:hypothetical protein D043_2463A, partial [Vibrio parahaemolyticus EKP-021]
MRCPYWLAVKPA